MEDKAPLAKQDKDKKWADKHGIIGAIGYHSGLRGRKLRRHWENSKNSFSAFMELLKRG